MHKVWKRALVVLTMATVMSNNVTVIEAARSEVSGMSKFVEEIGVENTEKLQKRDNGNSAIKIVGFEKLSEEKCTIEIDDEMQVPECIEEYPTELRAYVEDERNLVTIPVKWENTSTYNAEGSTIFYEYTPKWDENEYILAENVSIEKDVPKITIILKEGDESTADKEDDPQYDRAMQQKASSSSKRRSRASLAGSTYIHNERFAGYAVLNGIDVSKYQGYIDWNDVKNAGVDFAIIRVGYRGTESGTLNEDDYYQINIERAINAGLKVGVYIYSQAITNAEAVEEANYVLDRISAYNITLPVVIDYEYAGEGKGRLYNANLSVDAATSVCNSFCARVAEAGYTPMVYANKNMLEKKLNASAISKNYKVWLANYTTQTSYQGAYEFWQYSSKGSVNGIGGNVDCNFWYRPKSEVNGQTIADGTYVIASALNNDMVLNIVNGEAKDGANLSLLTRNGSLAQSFTVRYIGDGKYALIANCSGKMIDVAGGGNVAGTNVHQYRDNGLDTQRWYIQDAGNGYYYLESCANGMYLDVDNGTATDGTNVQIWNYNQSAAQKFKFSKTGLNLGNDGNWYYYTNGRIDTNYVGMASNDYGWWYVRNGSVDWNYTGVASNEYGLWYMQNGALNLAYTGMACDEKAWYYVVNGAVDKTYTGMACNEYGWWYYQNGQLNWDYTGMACNEYGWWYYQNGQLNWDYTGMACNEYGWWYYQNGQLSWDYTGMACNEYGWWYYQNGQLNRDYTGMACNEYGWWYYQNGQLNWDYTGMACNEYGWWYYQNGQLNWDYTGIGYNEYGAWYYENGSIRFDYTGPITINGVSYNVVGGMVM